MANLSGLIKTISSLSGGAPTDEDYFIFGKSDLKKVSWKSIKDTIIGRTYQVVETNIGVNANVYKRCGVVYFRMGGYISKSIGISYTQICVLPDGYRPVSTLTLAFVSSIASNYGFYLQIDTSGAVKIRGSKTFESGEAINAMTSYVT